METWASKIIDYISNLDYTAIHLPNHIGMMNPYASSEFIQKINHEFYHKFYSDNNQRLGIVGINPGRFGAGTTGIPFTDSKRLVQYCGIEAGDLHTHEPSSVFIYDMIEAYGGTRAFYSKFYITSTFPLGFTTKSKTGKTINYNYYDDNQLLQSVKPFIIQHLKTQINFGLNTNVLFCLGSGKNYQFLKKLNNDEKLVKSLIPLDHPRFIMQYRLKHKDYYIDDYLTKLKIEKF